MNILFYYRYCRVGGVQTVSHFLANAFQVLGHKCVVYYWEGEATMAKKQLDSAIPLVVPNERGIDTLTKSLSSTFKDYKIDVVINQAGHDRFVTKLLVEANCGRVPIISVYHNMPGFSLNLYIKKSGITGWFCDLMHRIDVLRIGLGMRYIYRHSEYFVLLSESFIPLFSSYSRLSFCDKLKVIPNPITVACPKEEDLSQKEKEIIYVGRLSKEKRVDRILRIWSNIEKQYPEWRLTIVGDGEERLYLETLAVELGLSRVNFEGIQDASIYYRRASILLLTSDFEGFGLVVIEAMAYQVVPIVYASYPAVYDIIQNQKDGVIIEKGEEDLVVEEFACKIRFLIESSDHLRFLAKQARNKSLKFSIDKVTDIWMQLFSSLKDN